MKIYFLSAEPCALTLNELYFGITDRFERSLDVTLSDCIYAKFSPAGKLPIGFFITEKILTTPPNGCEVYLLPDGIAVYAKEFPYTDFTLHPIAQARFDNSLVTVFSQGGVQVSMETPDGFFIAPLPPSFCNCTLSQHSGLFFLSSDTQLAVFTSKGECVFLETVREFTVENGELRATLPLSDRLQRSAECVWSLSETGCARTQYIIKQPAECKEAFAEELLAFAFFESIAIGADFQEFLSDELAKNADAIVEFLGPFQAVTLCENPSVCGLVRAVAPSLFRVEHFTITQENGKITDVKAL